MVSRYFCNNARWFKGDITKLPRGVLSMGQIEEIYNQYEPKTPVQKRNKLLLSLVCYQGVLRQELDQLKKFHPLK